MIPRGIFRGVILRTAKRAEWIRMIAIAVAIEGAQ
jgi:hypothetical protein